MTPVAVIQKLLEVNPRVAGFILAGLAVLAAASIAVTFIGSNPNAIYLAGYILGLAFLATLVAFVANDKRMRLVLGWSLTVTFIAFLIGLVDSALAISGRLPTPACYVRIVIEAPQACERRLIPTIEITGLETPETPLWHWRTAARRGDAQVWRVQADIGAHARATPYDGGPIALQIASSVPVDQAGALAQSLANLGWPITRGETVSASSDQTEVRYFDPGAAEDAVALAQAIKAERPDTRIVVRDFSQSGLIAATGLLEIWLSE